MRKPVPLRVVAPTAELPTVRPADVPTVLSLAAEKAREGRAGAMATVLARHGSAPATPGQKLYAADDGTLAGTVGGGALEREVVTELLRMVRESKPAHVVRSFHLGAELGMCCGGGADVLLEPIAGLVPLLVVGAGHVATATAPLLAKVGFAVTVVDARQGWADEGRIPGVRMVHGDHDDAAELVPTSGAVLVMTHDHALDQEVIEWALRRGYAWIGGVGSRAKAKRTRDRLELRGFSEADRARVRMPVGLSVGARLPDEIAVAIAAELVAWRRGVT